QRVGEAARSEAPELRDRAGAAVAVLSDLGGAAEVCEADGHLEIRGRGCPLADVVRQYPQTCALTEGLIEAIVGVPVAECCERGDRPSCAFVVGNGAARKACGS
ncbi:MAG: hypothetical protein IRZ00_18020, partial [Gemmatimonadetes bacterium]|nr:hypothetical protein [Gemmatimonadota bacterium]